MRRLSIFLYTQILGKKILDEFGDPLGELKDIYVTTDEGYPRVIGYKIKKNGNISNYEFRTISVNEDNSGRIIIKTTGSREILARTYTYLLSEHLLDKKIVDITGKKVVRVNDLKIAEMAGEFRVIGVETGALAKFKRMGIPSIGKAIYKLFHKDYECKMLMWDDVESIDMVNENLQKEHSFTKLSALHPADLADILEDLDTGDRKKVFESLDEDLAAETFEEIDDEYKGSIIKDLSETKTAELLENMGNDEIADLLEELDGDEREKVLVNLEQDDAKEVNELLKYEDEAVGSIMTTEYISFGLEVTVGETKEILKEMNPDEDIMYYIYVTDESGKLKGTVLLKDLIVSEDDKKLQDIMEDTVTTVKSDENIDEAIEQAVKYNLISTAVVDNEDIIVGIVQMQDIIDEYFYPIWKKKNKGA
ncbi:MAG: magnesium transporter [Clostridiales bacterium]|nr:magnesium transporter [Clostridiales bacterium]